jgi:hypothetical protein
MSKYDVLGDETAVGLVSWMLNAGPPFSPRDAKLIAQTLDEEREALCAGDRPLRWPDWDRRLDRLIPVFESLADLPTPPPSLSGREDREVGAFEKLERLDHNVEDLMDEGELEMATGQGRR